MHAYKKITKTVFVLAAVLAAGTSGYVLIEGWSFFDAFYMTVITLATVGYGETHPLTPGGRVFTVVLILSGISILLYAVSAVTSFFMDGELNRILRRKKMTKKISRLKNHYIICGAGRTGAHIVNELEKTGRDFAVADKNDGILAKFPSALVVKGDVTDENTLKEAGIEHAAGLFAVLPSDEENIFLIITARQVNPGIKIVAKSLNESSVKKLFAAGASTVVQPGLIGGMRMVSEMVRPAAVSFLDVMLKEGKGDLRVEEIEVKNPSVKNIPSAAIEKSGALLLAVSRPDGHTFNPTSGSPVSVGDKLILMGTAGQIALIRETV